MVLTEENKKRIDGLSYEQLLSHWRFASIGDPWFQGETGDYWAKRMKDLRNVNHSQVSKSIGWDR